MKTILKNITVLILALLTTQAYSQVYVTTFKVQDAYLQNGKILIKSATSTTEIKIEVTFATYRESNGTPKTGSIKTKLGTANSSGGVNFLSAEQNVSSTEFSTDPFVTKIYTINIEKSKLANNTIDLFTQPAGFSWGVFTGKSYSYVLEPTITTYYNVAKSAYFVKDNCPPGSDVQPNTTTNYSVPANKYSSTISQADADAKAQAEIDANGQNKANTEGLCIEFGNVKTPNGSNMIYYYDYSEDIKWNASIFNGSSVKIELFESNTLIRTISSSTPNTGLLKNVLILSKTDPSPLWGVKLKITSLQTGESYFSNGFNIFQD